MCGLTNVRIIYRSMGAYVCLPGGRNILSTVPIRIPHMRDTLVNSHISILDQIKSLGKLRNIVISLNGQFCPDISPVSGYRML
jgi:hypothetical protein